MKSTVYPDHPRASASFAYRHLLHWKRGDPERGEKKPPRGVRGGKSACGSGRKKPRRRSGRKTARP